MTPGCRKPAWILVWLTSLAMLSIVALADDQSPAPDQPNPAGQAAKSDKPTGADQSKQNERQPSLLDRLKKELFKELDESPEATAEEDAEQKLDRAAKGMRSAGEKLTDSQTGEETRKIQEQVIRDLDDLIKQLQQPPPNNSGGGGSSASSSSSRSRMSQLQQSSGSARSAEQKSAEARTSQASGGQEKKSAEGSEQRTESERKAAEESARKNKLELDVWGHLPAHLREQLLNTYGERMLPKYEQLVKQFYEALSEQSEPAGRRK